MKFVKLYCIPAILIRFDSIQQSVSVRSLQNKSFPMFVIGFPYEKLLDQLNAFQFRFDRCETDTDHLFVHGQVTLIKEVQPN